MECKTSKRKSRRKTGKQSNREDRREAALNKINALVTVARVAKFLWDMVKDHLEDWF